MSPVWIGNGPEAAEEWERQRRIAERVANQPPHEPLYERYEWERENVSPEHPGGTGMRRVRPKSVLSQMPRRMRAAELVCTAESGTPRVVAIVYPRGVPLDRAEVLTEHGGGPVGTNVVVFCRCGTRHLIDGGQLRSELMALGRGRSVPVLDVRRVGKDWW